MGKTHKPYRCQRYYKGRYKGENWACAELMGHDGPCSPIRQGAVSEFDKMRDQEHTRRFRCYTWGELKSALQWARPGDAILVEDGE